MDNLRSCSGRGDNCVWRAALSLARVAVAQGAKSDGWAVMVIRNGIDKNTALAAAKFDLRRAKAAVKIARSVRDRHKRAAHAVDALDGLLSAFSELLWIDAAADKDGR